MPVDSRMDLADEPYAIVIGGRGWTGRTICQSLRRDGIIPIPIGRDDAPFLPLNEFMLRCGFAQDGCAPLAVVNCLRPSDEYEAEAYVEVSGELARACKQLATKYIHIGSAAEYGSNYEGLIEEDTRKHPDSAYGIFKLRASEVALKFDGIVVRPFNLVGPQQPTHTVAGEWVQQIRNTQVGRSSITILNGLVTRDFVPLLRLGEAVAWLIRNSPNWNCLNVCTGRATSFGEYCQWLIRIARRQKIINETLSINDLGEGRITQMIGDPRRLDSIPTSTPVDLESLVIMSLS